jgi:hypothetical protein
MFDGNTFFPVTGTPIRKIACMIRPLADADPVPLAVAILKAKSLTLFMSISDLGSRISEQSQIADRRWIRNPLDPRSEIDVIGRPPPAG